MTSVHELGRLHAFISHQKRVKPVIIEGPNWFGQVPIIFFVIQVYLFVLVVRKNPWKDRILRKIRKGSISSLVQMHQVLIIRNLLSLPKQSYIFELVDANTLL
jgi:uncharacterized membrane protein